MEPKNRPPHPGEDRCPGCNIRIVDAGGEAPTALYLDRAGKVTNGVRQVVEVAPGHVRVLVAEVYSDIDASADDDDLETIRRALFDVMPLPIKADMRREEPAEQRVRELEAELAEVRGELEEAIGRTPDPARATVQLAREVAGIAEHRRIDADHYRSEAAKVGELEGALAEMVNRENGIMVDLDGARAEIRSLRAKLAAATLGGTEAERLQQLEEAARDARDWLAEALNCRANGGDVDEVLKLAHGRLEALNLGDGDPDATTDHAHPDDSAGADEDRVAALERAIVEAVGLLACHDLHGDETALAARQAFERLGIPGLEMVSRCSACAEPIEGELERCPDCGISLANGNLITGLEATGAEEDDGDA